MKTYEQILDELTARDERVVVMTAENRAAIRNLPAKIGDRFIDVGIAEQTMIGAAAGLALRGRVPIVHALATFITLRAFEFIRTDVGIPNLPVKLVGGVAGFLSDGNGPTHQAIEDIALMRGIPNMNIFCPADAEDLAICLEKVLLSDAPFYIRHNALPACVSHNPDFEIGKAETISEGNDITILTYGFLLREAVTAKDILEEQGVSVRLLNLRTVKPLDEEAVLKAAHETRAIVTVEDHFLTGGLYSILGELFMKHRVAPDVLPIALDNHWFKPALLNDVLQYEGFTGEQIAARILEQYPLATLHGTPVEATSSLA